MLIVRDEDGGAVHTWPTRPVTCKFSQVIGPIANRLRSRVRKDEPGWESVVAINTETMPAEARRGRGRLARASRT